MDLSDPSLLTTTMPDGGARPPFGGFDRSGLGRKGSRHGIEEFTALKYILTDGLET
jgi:acyl-CoA reductase-like NAD-dependent aldehyde dehydrogenase